MNPAPEPPAGEPYGAHPSENLHNVYYTLLKRRYIVLGVVLATWLLATIATFVQTPLFLATSLVQIDWGKINLVEDVIIQEPSRSTSLYATQEKILRSRVLARRVVDELSLWEHPIFDAEPSEDTTKAIAGQLSSMLRVVHVRNTQLVEVSFLTPEPELSARTANELVRQYVQFNIQADSELARGTSSFIQEEVEELRRGIVEKERRLRELSRDTEMVDADAGSGSIAAQRYQDLAGQLTTAEAERARAEALYTSVRNTRASTLPEVSASPGVRALKQQVASLRDERARLASQFKEDWPEVQRLTSALQEAERNLASERRAEARKVVAAARVQYQAALERENILRGSIEAFREEAQRHHAKTADYDQVRAELSNEREVLQGLLKRQSETDLSADLGERQPVKVRVVEAAETPASAYSPDVLVNLAVGVLLGLILGVGVAFLLDYFDSSISTVDDVRRFVTAPYLGMIPRYTTEAAENRDAVALPETSGRPNYLPMLYDRQPKSAENRKILSERFRFLRGSLLLSTPGAAPKLVLITSPDQNCGKTFVSCNLGATLVQMNKRVLLVDSDLRNPSLHKVFRYRNHVGLTNVLTGQKELKDGCIMKTDVPNLFLLMAGPKSPNPGELLAAPAMSQVLDECARHFDFIVLDSAPLLPVYDTHALSEKSDALLLVTRAGVTSRQAVRTSIDLVERSSGRVTGVVLNDVDLRDYAQYFYHTNYTYEYGRYAAPAERLRDI